jgi:hypothetical protein
MNNLFGGEVQFGTEREYVKASDGRTIPFTSLSSGQQELLPMWSIINYFAESDISFRQVLRSNSRISKETQEIIYIEEPEAHLFPSAQSILMEFLITSARGPNRQRSLILTTHSPYIMGKLNVFLKAGQLGHHPEQAASVSEIVPKDCWLTEETIGAYAISNGELHNLIDADGLIDASYLDEISDNISHQFSSLLAIEARNEDV